MPAFPEADWFLALGSEMTAAAESFRRLGFIETRLVVRVDPDNGAGKTRYSGLVFDGYTLAEATPLADPGTFDPDFVICGPAAVWRRMLDEIRQNGRPMLRHTLNSLVLLGEELWLESSDQLREDKFYRYNQSLQEFFNLASRLG